jgi:hypothetical protein
MLFSNLPKLQKKVHKSKNPIFKLPPFYLIPASCARDQFACVKSGTCIPAKLRCDGKADDCADGSNLDEIGCSKNESEFS